MFAELHQFHFIRPLCLALLPIAMLAWWLLKRRTGGGQWATYLPTEVIKALRVSGSVQSQFWHWGLLVVSLILITALAGPTWTKQTVPAVKNQQAMVIVLDLSPSMLAQDLRPDRLTLAKFTLIDILRARADGQTALVAYAGDAHTVSPLTDDPNTIEALLPALYPQVMPKPGSNTEAAIELAQQLLDAASATSGDILLITDGVAEPAINDIEQTLATGYRLSILGVGGYEPAPIPAAGGGFVRKADGEIVLSGVNHNQLQRLANVSAGRYVALSQNSGDVSSLLQDAAFEQSSTELDENEPLANARVFDAWLDMGHWLALLILPILLLLFRKGVIYLLPLVFLLPPDASYAQESSGTFWRNLWQTPDQQATELLEQQEYEAAANTFKRDDWSAIAHYKNGDYQAALEKLADRNDVTSLYNKANALAFTGELEQAIAAYESVLEQESDHADALHNKQVLEALLAQSQNDQSDQSQNGESQENQDSQSQQGDQQQSDSQPGESGSEQPQGGDQQPQEQTSEDAQNSSQANQQSEPQEGQQDQAEPGSESSEQEQQAQTSEQTDEGDSEQTATQQNDTEETQGEQQQIETALAENGTLLKDSSEQWLRTIQDDPSGLLRRKFEYQSRLRAQQQQRGLRQSKTETRNDERY